MKSLVRSFARIAALAVLAPFAGSALAAQSVTREFSTDRPDFTESPISVPKGRFQFESDIIGVSDDRSGNVRSRSMSLGGINAKIGVHDRVDVQFVTELWSRATADQVGVGGRSEVTGMGDLTVRVKVNAWGNDGGNTALAVMPFVKLPTAAAGITNGAVEGGLIVPLSLSLPRGFGLGVMTELDVLRRDASQGYFLDFVQSAALGRDIVGPLAGYVELVGALAPTESARLRATGNAGFTLAVMDDVQLDFGANFGLTQDTERVSAFVGFSFRR